MSTARRAGLAVVVLLALGTLTLVGPASVAACTCDPNPGDGDVVFTGTVTSAPALGLVGAPDGGGLYEFEVVTVERGDPVDGRVFTPRSSASCGTTFALGAMYRVHASIVDPDNSQIPGGEAPGVPLMTSMCSRNQLIAAPTPGTVLQALAFTPLGVFAGVATVGALGLYVARRRRARQGAVSQQ